MAEANSYLDGLFGHAIKSSGTLLPQRSFINVTGTGIEVTDDPTTNTTTINGTGVFTSLTEAGHGYAATSGWINEGATSAGIWGGYSTASEAQLQGWVGSSRTLSHGSADVLLYTLVVDTSAKWRVGGVDRLSCDGTTTTITGPDGASGIVAFTGAVELVSDVSVQIEVNSVNRLNMTTTTTTLPSPSAASSIAIANGGTTISGNVGFFGVAPSAQASAYTQTYSTATRINNFAETVAYTGIDNAQGGTPYAKSAELENLRLAVVTLAGLVNALIDDQQAKGLAG